MKILKFLFLLFASWCFSLPKVCAQSNPYPYGTAHYWMAQGTISIQNGMFDKGYEYLQKAQAKYHEWGNTALELQATQAMGGIKFFIGEWDKALKLYDKAENIATQLQDDYKQAEIVIDIMDLCSKGNNIEFYNYTRVRLDSLYKNTKSMSVKALYHAYQTQVFLSKRDYEMADFYLQQYGDLLQQLTVPEREAGLLTYYQYTSALKQGQGKYNDAIRYYKKYIEQYKKVYGENQSQSYQSSMQLCQLYAMEGDSTTAFAYADSLRRRADVSLQNKELHANLYNTLGTLYSYFKKYETALACFNKTYTLLSDKETELSSTKLKSLANKTTCLISLKRYDEAFSAVNEYLSATQRQFGKESGRYNEALYTKGLIEFCRNNRTKANIYLRISMEYLLKNIKQMWKDATPSQQEDYVAHFFNTMSNMATQSLEIGEDCNYLTAYSYTALLLTKCLLLESDKTLAEMMRKNISEEDKAIYHNLLATNQKLSALYQNPTYNKKEIDSLTILKNEFEVKVKQIDSYYNRDDSYMDIDFKYITYYLNYNEVMIDFTDYDSTDSTHQYLAFITDKHHAYPLLKRCFEQRQIDSLLADTKIQDLYDYDIMHDKAVQIIWNPIKNYIPEGSTVYYVPSGIIHGIALESLPLADGTTLGQHYNFVRLSSGREIVRERTPTVEYKRATLYGGLQYDLSPEEMKAESKVYPATAHTLFMRSENYNTKKFEALPYTQNEVNKIEEILKNNGYDVKIYSGSKGNAESFLSLPNTPSTILHIATHGFYYTPEKAKNISFFQNSTDAMRLSGLVFSGGNTAWLGKEKSEGVLGGVLTAQDIANINLKETDLVVLSTCESALGKVTAEGVYGLQRAFKKAGVGTIVMSLWKVSDVVTSEFMVAFYKELFATNNAGDKRKAFEKAKSLIREKYPEPCYWAAFVMLD